MRGSPPVALLLALVGAPVHAEDVTPAWFAEAVGHVPLGWVAGRAYRTEDNGLKVFIAVFPKGADHPMTPGNAFDPGQVLEVVLRKEGDSQRVVSATMHARSPLDRVHSSNEDYHADVLERLQAKAEKVPGVMPCLIRGWAASESSMGTPVRAKPDDAAEIVGRLAPPVWGHFSEAASTEGMRAEFDITGYTDGWFRIENATPPGTEYLDPPPEGHPPTYSGMGWIRATEVRAAYANTRMPVPRLLQYPNVDAADFLPGEGASSPESNLDGDGTLTRLHACSANWGLTTARDFQRGWWRGICSNQVTNCS